MIGILIVEDEYLVRVGIKSIIGDSLNEHIRIIGDAGSAEEGLNIYKRYKPQIVITDIQLPKMNGLEMISKIREQSSEVEFIIISCHADFSYAKKAIEYGVSDYIEKSEMDPKQLLNAIEKLARKISEKKSSQKSEEGSEILTKNDQLRKIFTGQVSEERIIKKIFKELQTPYELDGYAMILFKVEQSSSTELDTDILSTFAEEVMSEKFSGTVYDSGRGELYVFINFDKSRYDGVSGCSSYISRVIKEFKRISKSTVKILVEPLFAELNQISCEYSKMEKLKKYLLFIDKDSHRTLKDIEDRICEQDITLLKYDELYRLIINGEVCEVENWIANLFYDIKNSKYSLINLNGHCNQLITNLNKVMKYYCDYFENLYPQIYFDYTDIGNNEDINDIMQWFQITYKEVTEYCSRFKFYQGDNKIITQAINFMINHHKEELSLEDIAVHCNISRVYLCQLFKKETNRTITDVLKEIRIEKAKLLIELDEYKMYEIAELVGFGEHSSYFVKVFKSITGYTPSEYKEKIISKQNE